MPLFDAPFGVAENVTLQDHWHCPHRAEVEDMLPPGSVRLTLLALMLPIPLAGDQVTHSYMDEGERHYAAVLGRPADPCPDDSTVSHAVCMDKELTIVGPHLVGFIAGTTRGTRSEDYGTKQRCAERTGDVEQGRCSLEAVPHPNMQTGIRLFRNRQSENRRACPGRLRAEDGSSLYGATPRTATATTRHAIT